MNKTKYIVPVSNFFIELAFKLGDFIYSPSFEFFYKKDMRKFQRIL